MSPIVCKNDIRAIINKLQEFLAKDRIIKGIRLVDSSESEVVLLIDEQPISQEKADTFWQGYQTALGAIN